MSRTRRSPLDNLFIVGECLRSQARDVAATLRESLTHPGMQPTEALLLVGEIRAACAGLGSLAENLETLAMDALAGEVSS